MCFQLWESIAHLVDKYGKQLKHECFFLVKEGVCISHGATQDTANHVSSLGIGRQLTVGNRESHGAKVVCTYAHSHVYVFLLTVFQSRNALFLLDNGLENIGVVIGMLALQGTYETFKSHTCINHIHGKFFQRTICLAIELHEHKVPNLDYLWVVLVNEFSSWHLCLFFGCARVEVYLRTRSARSRISHFPEIVVLVSVDDMVGRNMLSPIAGCFIVAWDIFLW